MHKLVKPKKPKAPPKPPAAKKTPPKKTPSGGTTNNFYFNGSGPVDRNRSYGDFAKGMHRPQETAQSSFVHPHPGYILGCGVRLPVAAPPNRTPVPSPTPSPIIRPPKHSTELSQPYMPPEPKPISRPPKHSAELTPPYVSPKPSKISKPPARAPAARPTPKKVSKPNRREDPSTRHTPATLGNYSDTLPPSNTDQLPNTPALLGYPEDRIQLVPDRTADRMRARSIARSTNMTVPKDGLYSDLYIANTKARLAEENRRAVNTPEPQSPRTPNPDEEETRDRANNIMLRMQNPRPQPEYVGDIYQNRDTRSATSGHRVGFADRTIPRLNRENAAENRIRDEHSPWAQPNPTEGHGSTYTRPRARPTGGFMTMDQLPTHYEYIATSEDEGEPLTRRI